MLILHLPKPSPRIEYVAGVVFRRVLGLEFVIQIDASVAVPAVSVSGSEHRLPLLAKHPVLREGFHDALRELPEAEEALARAFWFLNEYELDAQFPLDVHGRSDESHRFAIRNHQSNRPFVQEIAAQFAQQIQKLWPAIPIKMPVFTWQITFDVDWPYRYRGRPLWVQGAALLRDTVKGNRNEVRERLRVVRGGADPYDTYGKIAKDLSPSQTAFFFLSGGKHKHDSPFSFQNREYRKLIRSIADQDFPVGIHPSYLSAEEPERIASETAALAEIIGRPVRISRQHFLKFRTPETYRALLAAGIENEFTGGWARALGSRFGINLPFPWYDRQQESETPLILHPVQAMDRTFQKYLKLKPLEAGYLLRKEIQNVRHTGGCFHLLLHNETLSNDGDWLGWLAFYRAALAELVEAE